MRIDIQSIIAVLSLAAILFPCMSTQNDHALKSRRTNTRRDSKVFAWSTGGDLEETEGRSWHRDHMTLLREEGGETGQPVECCPSRLEMVEPEGGKNEKGMFVELYRDGEYRQRFYEISCREDVYNKPCRFLDRRLFNQSRCVQKYSFTYALVRDAGFVVEEERSRHHHHHHRAGFSSKEGWKMDYIQVRSGCSCEITPKLKKKRNLKNKKTHRSRRLQEDLEMDET